MSTLVSANNPFNNPLQIRITPTSEGLAFCSVSAQAGGFVVSPGEQLLLTVEASMLQTTVMTIMTPAAYGSSQGQPLQAPYASFTLRIEKITDA